MIRLLLRLPIAFFLLLPLSWGAGLLVAGGESAMKGRLSRELEAAYPEDSGRAALRERTCSRAAALGPLLVSRETPRTGLLRAAIEVTLVHASLLASLFPLLLLGTLAGLVRGLRLRERLHRSRGYASPAAAGLGRGLLSGGLLFMLLFGTSPLPISLPSLGVLPILLFPGAALYAANLPLKL